MNMETLQTYALPALMVGYFVWRLLRFRGVRGQIPTLLQGGAVVVDVRSRGEFASGAREGSINIPLDELNHGISKLDPNRAVIVCCASGTRSAMAATVLKRKGFLNVVNAGPWTNTVTVQ